YPSERLAFMLRDSKAQLVVTQSSLIDLLLGHQTVCLDGEAATLIGASPKRNLECRLSAWNLAYVLYTSGSTGRPKGVAMGHGSLVNLITWQIRHTSGSGGRTLQFAPLSFDVSFQECFSTWCSGGALELIEETHRGDFEGLLEHISQRGVRRL